ncbi:MAG: lysylphosphatidylglycerol synthase transmembrane domain-containing protein [bacterium]|nr:lysylphosphatidylglycerol synthase transmembrane domain-containing protein [bacterium]
MKKSSEKLKIIINVSILLIVLVLVFYFTFKDNYKEIIDIVFNMNLFWLIFALALMLMYYFFISLGLHDLVINNNQKYSIVKAIKLIIVTQFFNGITPFSSGGQPFQIYYLKEDKIPLTTSTNIVFQNFIVYQIALIILGLIAIVYNKMFNLFTDAGLIKNMVIIGFVINSLVLVLLFIISFGKKINHFISNKGISFLVKLKLIKNEEAIREKVNTYLANFYNNAMDLSKNKWTFIKIVGYNVIALIVFYSIPVFLAIGIGYSFDMNIMECIVASAYVMLIGAFMPLPGGSGGIEFSFVYFFGYYFDKAPVMILLLLWRCVTYYFGMMLGGLTLLFGRKKKCE